MVIGIGVDIVEISRFERFLQEGNEQLFKRLFSDAEKEYCAARRNCAQHYALRFAAKEAFLKACGTGLREGVTWRDMEVANDALGKPEMKLQKGALDLYNKLGISHIHLSLSHDSGSAVAMIVLERQAE